MSYRVMQVMETNELCCVFEGDEEDCDNWIDENYDNYPESTFFVEATHEGGYYDYDNTNGYFGY